MKQIGVKQARQELSDLIARAEAGEEVIITRQGMPVAKLVPVTRTLKRLPSLAEFRRGLGRRGTPAAHLVREERAVPDGRKHREPCKDDGRSGCREAGVPAESAVESRTEARRAAS